MADHPGKLSESKERQQQDETHDADGQEAPGTPAEKGWKALGDGVSVEQTYCGTLDDVKEDEHDGEDQALVEDGVDKGPVREAGSEIEVLAHEKHLGKDPGVDEGEGVLLGIKVVLCEDEALVDRRSPKTTHR